MKKTIFEKVDEIRNDANESQHAHKFAGTFVATVVFILYIVYCGGLYLPIFSELTIFFINFAVQLHILTPMLVVLLLYIIYCFNAANEAKKQYEYFSNK